MLLLPLPSTVIERISSQLQQALYLFLKKGQKKKMRSCGQCEVRRENSLSKHRQPQLCHMNPKIARYSTKVTQKGRTDTQTLGGVKFISTFSAYFWRFENLNDHPMRLFFLNGTEGK